MRFPECRSNAAHTRFTGDQVAEKRSEGKDANKEQDKSKGQHHHRLTKTQGFQKVGRRLQKNRAEQKPAFSQRTPAGNSGSSHFAKAGQNTGFHFQRKKKQGRNDVKKHMAAGGGKAPPKSLGCPQISECHQHRGNAGSDVGTHYHGNGRLQAQHTGCNHGHNAGGDGGGALDYGGCQHADEERWKRLSRNPDNLLGKIFPQLMTADGY